MSGPKTKEELVKEIQRECSKQFQKEFVVEKSLGSGAFGTVLKVRHIVDGNFYAVKDVEYSHDCDTQESDYGAEVRREVQMLSSLNHNNIIRYHNSWIESINISKGDYNKLEGSSTTSSDSENELSQFSTDDQENASVTFEVNHESSNNSPNLSQSTSGSFSSGSGSDFISVNHLYITMELCENRSLSEVIDDNLYTNDTKIIKYLRQICEGLLYIHQKGIIHRDLKPENIFLTADDIIKIGDFGLSRQVQQIGTSGSQENNPKNVKLTEGCGTSYYKAPEVTRGREYNNKADLYSLGVIYFEMCTPPITIQEKVQIFPLTVETIDRYIPLQTPPSFPTLTARSKKIELIKRLVDVEATQRIDCDDILQILPTDARNEDRSHDRRNIIQQNSLMPVPQLEAVQQYTTFEIIQLIGAQKKLSLDCLFSRHYIDNINFFYKKAVEVFELHGARNIPLPVFLPPLMTKLDDDFIKILDVKGNVFLLPRNSRLQFCFYLGYNGITDERRYFMGKAFKENNLSPREEPECVFDIVSSVAEDWTLDAEIYCLVQQLYRKLFRNSQIKLHFRVNHSSILKSVLQTLPLKNEEFQIFTTDLIGLKTESGRKNLVKELMKVLEDQGLCQKIAFIFEDQPLVQFRDTIQDNPLLNNQLFAQAIEQIFTIIDRAKDMGADVEEIYLAPFMDQPILSTIFCEVQIEDNVVARIERFDDYIVKVFQKELVSPINGKAFCLPKSAVGVSFDVKANESVIYDKLNTERADVLVMSKNKADAIPILKELWTTGLRCNLTSSSEHGLNTFRPHQTYRYKIEIVHGSNVRLHIRGTPSEGNWNDLSFKSRLYLDYAMCQRQEHNPSTLIS